MLTGPPRLGGLTWRHYTNRTAAATCSQSTSISCLSFRRSGKFRAPPKRRKAAVHRTIINARADLQCVGAATSPPRVTGLIVQPRAPLARTAAAPVPALARTHAGVSADESSQLAFLSFYLLCPFWLFPVCCPFPHRRLIRGLLRLFVASPDFSLTSPLPLCYLRRHHYPHQQQPHRSPPSTPLPSVYPLYYFQPRLHSWFPNISRNWTPGFVNKIEVRPTESWCCGSVYISPGYFRSGEWPVPSQGSYSLKLFKIP